VAVQALPGNDPHRAAVVLVIGAFTSVIGHRSAHISSTFVRSISTPRFLEDYFSFLAIGPLLPVPVPARDVPHLARSRHRIR
jgi:hypothetical protein